MKNTFKKLLPVIIVVLVMVAAFAVTAFATDDWVVPVQILNMSQSGVEKSGYTDIDGNEDWIQVSTPTDAKAAAYKQSNFYWTFNFRSYFNAKTKTYVVIPSWSGNTLSGRDSLSSNPAGTAPGDKALTAAEMESLTSSEYYTKRYPGDASYVYIVHCINAWMSENRNNIEHVEFRPYNGTATATAVIAEAFGSSVADDFVNVKTVKYTPTFPSDLQEMSLVIITRYLKIRPSLQQFSTVPLQRTVSSLQTAPKMQCLLPKVLKLIPSSVFLTLYSRAVHLSPA